MPAWWSKNKSTKKNDNNSSSKVEENNSNNPYTQIDTTKKRNKTKSIFTVDDSVVSRFSPSGSSGFSGFDSDSADKRGLPLPRPSPSDPVIVGVHGSGSGSASGSVSSVSSSGSSGEDQVDLNHNRGQVEMRFNIGTRSPGPGSRSPILGSRSPGPGSRTASKPTSPLHPRLSGLNLESPTGRSDDGRSECHPLPLPPGSPSSPPTLTSTRTNDNASATLATWKKGKLLGRGTFGHVYLGFNSHSGQMCAIKEVRVVSDDHTSKECLKQLNQEIHLLSQLSHPNIVRYYGSEMSDETLSVYLEYVSGGSIHKLLQEYGAFKEPVIQNYTRQILSGLAYLHGKNTVHRDIKGANILVGPNGEIKLADFGMAKHITASSSVLSFKGSPYWMAPEVVLNTNGYSLAVDIWSLGCTILEMATSKPPWSQYEGVAAIFKIGNSKDMPDIPDHLSHEAKSFIKLCLQREPTARPTALWLLDHPFVRDQATPRSNTMRDASSHPFDGSRSPPLLDPHPSRTSIIGSDVDYVTKPVVVGTRTLKSARDDVRTITSLPVSPCSSPLRQYGPAHRSCYSPPHPTYSIVGQNGYNFNERSLSPLRQSPKYTLDPFVGNSLKAHTPTSSPKTRLI